MNLKRAKTLKNLSNQFLTNSFTLMNKKSSHSTLRTKELRKNSGKPSIRES